MIKNLITAIFLTLNISIFSQTYFKIKTGLNLSQGVYLNKENNNTVKPYRKLKPGITTGFSAHLYLNKIISVQAEILYSQKGLKTVQIPYATNINTMNYLEIPVSGQYSLLKTKNSCFNLYFGGYGAFWTDGKYKRIDYYTGETVSSKVDFNNPNYKYSRIDAGIFAGIVYGINNIEFYLRYTQGMTGSSEKNTDALKNNVLSAGINYVFKK